MLNQLNIYGKTKLDMAIERVKNFEPPDGYYLAFSGGKDSIAVKKVLDLAGVKYEAYYNVTTVDAPEQVKFIKEYHPDVIFSKPRWPDGRQITMWNLIPHKKRPPTRLVRYCCKYFKEGEGHDRFVVTGVRWAESTNRAKKRGGLEVSDNKSDFRDLIDPDNPNQDMIHVCQQKAQRILNPIIDWTDEDVWEFIKEYNIPYCKLYDEGIKRLGCIGCPLAGADVQRKEFERYPKIKQAYLRAFDEMLKERERKGLAHVWDTAEDVMKWWLFEDTESQAPLLEILESEGE